MVRRRAGLGLLAGMALLGAGCGGDVPASEPELDTRRDLTGVADLRFDAGAGERMLADLASDLATSPDLVDPQAHCMSGVRDGDESDVDCGGAMCKPCEDGKRCAVNNDCFSERCEKNACQPELPWACNNKKRDNQESDVDCGGPLATRCGDGRACVKASDCWGGRCDAGRCQPGKAKTLSFGAPTIYKDGAGDHMEIADLNNDGLPDAVAWGPGAFLVLPNQGNGRLGKETLTVVTLTWFNSLVIADMDGDGWKDIVVADQGQDPPRAEGEVRIYYNNQFKSWTLLELPGGWMPLDAQPADFNGDGRLDIAVAFWGKFWTQNDPFDVQGHTEILYNQGARAWRRVRVNDEDMTKWLLPRDYDGDCRPDLLVHTFGRWKTELGVFLNRGRRGFPVTNRFAVLDLRYGASWDLNADGVADLFTASAYTELAAFVHHWTPQVFVLRQTLKLPNGSPQEQWTPRIADMNADGRPDVITAGAVPGVAAVLIYLNTGNGMFAPPAAIHVPGPGGPPALAIGDLTSDGLPDIVYVSEGANPPPPVVVVLNTSK